LISEESEIRLRADYNSLERYYLARNIPSRKRQHRRHAGFDKCPDRSGIVSPNDTFVKLMLEIAAVPCMRTRKQKKKRKENLFNARE